MFDNVPVLCVCVRDLIRNSEDNGMPQNQDDTQHDFHRTSLLNPSAVLNCKGTFGIDALQMVLG